jgi:hypothetical protein
MWWALTGGKGHERVGLGADSLGESGNKHDHRDRVQMGATMHRTTAKQTRVLGKNGRQHYAGVCGSRRGTRGYGHRGINKTSIDFVFAKPFT